MKLSGDNGASRAAGGDHGATSNSKTGERDDSGIFIVHDVALLPPRSQAIGLLLRDLSASVELWCLEVLQGLARGSKTARSPLESFVF